GTCAEQWPGLCSSAQPMRRGFFVTLLLLAPLALGVKSRDAPKPPRNVLPDLKHERVDYWVDQFSHTPEYRKKVSGGFSRKPRFQKMITRKLRERGLPQNLIYVAFE